MYVIALTILAIVFAIQIIMPKARLKNSGLFGILIFIAAIICVFGFASYQSGQQYLLWKNDEMGKLLLPPYQDIDYLIFYARTRFFNPYLLSLFFGIAFLWAAKILNKKYQERFFEPIEPYLLATAIFLVGHPTWLFYLIFLIGLYLFIHFINSLFNWKLEIGNWKFGRRLPLYYLWLSTAILIILISRWVMELPWWQMLKI
jgi:hypothetical protein